MIKLDIFCAKYGNRYSYLDLIYICVLFPYPNFFFSNLQFRLVNFVIFADGFLTCSISLVMMTLYAFFLVSLTWCKIFGSASFKPIKSLTEIKEIHRLYIDHSCPKIGIQFSELLKRSRT